MSLRPTYATLCGFDKQHPIPALDALSGLIHEHPPDDLDLELLAQEMRPRRGIISASWVKHPMTSDNYRWFGAIEAEAMSGRIALLVPYCSDPSCRDGVVLDRSVALYTRGDVPPGAVNSFVRQVFMRYQGIMAQKDEESAAIRMGRFRFPG